MININELLNKEKITGEDVGRLIICNDIRAYRAQTGMDEVEDGAVTQEMMDSLMERIDTIEDAEQLECYVQLSNFVRFAQAMSYAYNQQAQNGFCRLKMYMTQAQQVEHARSMIELLPMIMTESQFNEMSAPGPLARLRGVAIVANNFPCRPKCLDAFDRFIQPEIDCFQEMMSLEHIKEMAGKIAYFRSDLMLSGLKHQIAYNRLFELIAERIGISGFTVFCTDTEELIGQIEKLNAQREAMAEELSGEDDERAEKLKILEEIFLPVDLTDLAPSPEAEAQVREMLRDISIFRTSPDSLISVLTGGRRQ